MFAHLMGRAALVLTLLSVSLYGRAYAQDAGTSSTADGGVPVGCGTITLEGECQGNVVVYCNDTTVERIDCTAVDPAALCTLISAEYGVNCALAPGEACYDEDDDGNLDPWFCQGTGAACVEEVDQVTCQENLGTCSDVDIGTCVGDRLVYYCNINQPYLLDCAAFGGTCSNQACRNVALGEPCDDESLICAPGSSCLSVLGSANMFACRSDAPADAGVSADAGSIDVSTNLPNPEEEKGCGCTAHGRRAPGIELFLGLILFFRRRGR